VLRHILRSIRGYAAALAVQMLCQCLSASWSACRLVLPVDVPDADAVFVGVLCSGREVGEHNLEVASESDRFLECVDLVLDWLCLLNGPSLDGVSVLHNVDAHLDVRVAVGHAIVELEFGDASSEHGRCDFASCAGLAVEAGREGIVCGRSVHHADELEHGVRVDVSTLEQVAIGCSPTCS